MTLKDARLEAVGFMQCVKSDNLRKPVDRGQIGVRSAFDSSIDTSQFCKQKPVLRMVLFFSLNYYIKYCSC